MSILATVTSSSGPDRRGAEAAARPGDDLHWRLTPELQPRQEARRRRNEEAGSGDRSETGV